MRHYRSDDDLCAITKLNEKRKKVRKKEKEKTKQRQW